MTSEYTELLKELLQQEEEIQFSSFDNDMAFVVGSSPIRCSKE